jgi:hypothetical protein
MEDAEYVLIRGVAICYICEKDIDPDGPRHRVLTKDGEIIHEQWAHTTCLIIETEP